LLLPNFDATTFVGDSVSVAPGGAVGASTEGYEAEKLDRCLELLKDHVNKNPNTPLELLARLHTIEYLIANHGVFISRFLNTAAVLVKDLRGRKRAQQSGKSKKIFLEIDTERDRMLKYLTYFGVKRCNSKILGQELSICHHVQEPPDDRLWFLLLRNGIARQGRRTVVCTLRTREPKSHRKRL
jgi:hypothetical protein